MKLLAVRNLLRVPALEGIQVEHSEHPNMIPIGSVFEIGAGDDLKKMRREDAELIGMLSFSKSVTLATPESIALVKAEIEADKRREANRSALDARGAVANVGAAFHNLTASLAESERKTAAARK